jgi:hypothetical protein
MSDNATRFSLRDMFLLMTLVATVVAMGFNFPLLTCFTLLVLSPFVFAVCMASLTNLAPRFRRLIAALVLGAVMLILAFALLIAMVPGR